MKPKIIVTKKFYQKSNNHISGSLNFNTAVRILFFVTLLLCSISAISQDYFDLGRNFLISKSKAPVILPSDLEFDHITEKGELLILESLNSECFIIFYKDNNNPRIIAYSTNNLFSIMDESEIYQDSSQLLSDLSSLTKRKIGKSYANNGKRVPVGPLLNTQWSQERWYNLFCPYDIRSQAGEHDYVGCIATAMGQIIKYYGKWNNFIIDKSYSSHNQVMSSSATKYSWASMIDKPLNYDLEICRFLADLGVLVEMNYGPACSSKGFGYAQRLGFSKIGYDNAITDWRNQNEDWLENIYENLERYHPVMIGGGNHAYICDGYDEDGRLHFNMGWGGFQDGYYDPSCVSIHKYYSKEGIFDAYPSGYEELESPWKIRVEEIDNDAHIVWSPPDNHEEVSYYNVYYSDNNYFSVNDTLVNISNLVPGAHKIMVSSVYPEGESLWIGPVGVFNPGENINISDPALAKAIKVSLNIAGLSENSNSFLRGDLATIRELDIKEPVSDISQIPEMPNIQILNLNLANSNEPNLEEVFSLLYLQKLGIKKFKGSIPDLSLLNKLVELVVDSCQLVDLSFLNNLDNLMVLEINTCEVQCFDFNDNLKLLAHLSINNCELPHTRFLNSMIGLRKLSITRCGLRSLDVNYEMPALTCLTLSYNNLETTNFFNYFPNLKMVCASNNSLNALDIHSLHPHLVYLDLTNNLIEEVNISFDLQSLSNLILKKNRLSHFPGLPHLPNLETLNLSANNIEGFRSNGMPGLKKLIISHNYFTHLEGISNFKSLSFLDIRSNGISDISPLFKDFNIENLSFLNLKGNPISMESYNEMVPELKEVIAQLNVPENYQPGSPCYPDIQPVYSKQNDSHIISWICEKYDSDRKFDLFMGRGDSLTKIEGNIPNNQIVVDINPGEVFSWQVKANFSDTSFYSGVYKVRKHNEMVIPFEEDFESYSRGDLIASEKSVWRLNDFTFDYPGNAEVSDDIWETDNEKALHINNKTHLTLDLNHLFVPDLKVEFDQYLISGSNSHVSFNKIDGLKMDIYSDGYEGKLYLNDTLYSEFEINTDDWNHFALHFSTQNKRLSISFNQKYIYNEYHEPVDEIFNIDRISFCSQHPDTHIEGNEFESYIDNISITRINQSTYTGHLSDINSEISVYPNPADQYFKVRGLNSDYGQCKIVLLNSLGQVVQENTLNDSYGSSGISISSLQAGMYYYKVFEFNKAIGTGNLLIAR